MYTVYCIINNEHMFLAAGPVPLHHIKVLKCVGRPQTNIRSRYPGRIRFIALKCYCTKGLYTVYSIQVSRSGPLQQSKVVKWTDLIYFTALKLKRAKANCQNIMSFKNTIYIQFFY